MAHDELMYRQLASRCARVDLLTDGFQRSRPVAAEAFIIRLLDKSQDARACDSQ